MKRKAVLSTVVISLLVVIGTVIAILYAQGYRLRDNNGAGILQETGVLAITSVPEGARVLVNGNLTTATDDTINLDEGTYDIKVEKDGYFPWQKTVQIEKGVVANFQVQLFPATPDLDPITRSGVSTPTVDPAGKLISFTVPSGQLKTRGIYTLNMTSRPIIPFGTATTQLVSDVETPFSSSSLIYSPSGTDLLATTSGDLLQTFLLNPTQSNQTPQNVTVSLNQIQDEWDIEAAEVYEDKIKALPSKVRPFARQSFENIQLSPGNEKVLYEASRSAEMPIFIKSNIPGRNPTPEDRSLKEGNIYVYDTKEDKNYLIYSKPAESKEEKTIPTITPSEENTEEPNPTPFTPFFVWHPTSSYLFYTDDGKIRVIEYDGTNKTTIYAGPFQDNFLYPWPDGSSLVILTNLNLEGTPPNLYSLSLE